MIGGFYISYEYVPTANEGKMSTTNIFIYIYVHYNVHWLNHKSLIYLVFSMITLQGTKKKTYPTEVGNIIDSRVPFDFHHLKNGGSFLMISNL